MPRVNSRGGFVKTAESAQKDTEALRLRSSGMTYSRIAEALGISKSHAYYRVQNALAAIPAEAVDEYRRLENERLDQLLEVAMAKALDPEAKGGALFAIDRVLAIQDRRTKLLGLDAPIRHEVITLDYIQSEIIRLQNQLGVEDGDDSGTAPSGTQETGTVRAIEATTGSGQSEESGHEL